MSESNTKEQAEQAEQAVEYGPVTAAEALPADWRPEAGLFLDAADGSNADIEALQSLAFEESTPEERADGFKEQGNEMFARGPRGYKAALLSYTKAIEEKEVNNAKKRSIYFSNRAIVQVKMSNFGRAGKDAEEAVKLDPTNLKAHHRGILAAKGLAKYARMVELCEAALEHHPENATIKKLHAQAVQKRKEQKEKEDARRRKEEAAVAKKKKVTDALAARGIVVGEPTYKSGSYAGEVQWNEEDEQLEWPVVFFYPEHQQSDFIRTFAEHSTFEDHLAVMFPVGGVTPWDPKGTYVEGLLDIFFQTNATSVKGDTNYKNRKWVRVPPSHSLLQALQMPGHIVPHMPTFHLLPKNCVNREKYLPVD